MNSKTDQDVWNDINSVHGGQPAKAAAAEESAEAAGAPKTTTMTDYLLADG